MDQLPVEILHLIFSYLHKNDLFQCQIACRSWYRPAQRYAYKNICLKYQSQADKYIDTIATFQGLGSFAESIDLNHVFLPQFYAASPDRFKVLTHLAELCPNVRYLSTIDTNNGFFKSLLPLYRQGHFQYLESIPVPNGWAVFRDYVQCVMAMRENLTRLTIGDATNRQCYFDDIFQDDFMDEMISRLNEFTHLKSLSFIKHTDKYMFEFDDIVQRCPLLDSFSFTAYSLKRIAGIGMFNHLGDDVYTRVDLQQIQPRPSISSFTGNFLLMSDESLKYIMLKFPRLHYLDINTNHQDHQLVADLKTRGFGFSSNVMMQFVAYVFQINTAKFHNVCLPDAVGFLSIFLDTMSFNGTMEVKYTQENHSYISADNPVLQFDVDSSHPSCRETNRITAIFETAKQHDKALIREQEANNPAYLTLLKSCGKHLQHLMLTHINQHVLQDYNFTTSSLFDYTLLCCCSLKSLVMVDCLFAGYYHTASATKTTNTSIEKLSLERCQLDQQVLTKVSHHVPLLKHLDLVNCEFINNVSRTVEINMPSTSFENLLYVDSLVSKAYIQLTMVSAGTMYASAQNDALSLMTFDEYQRSLDTRSTHNTLRLNICCKRIKTLSIGMVDNHISHCQIDKLLQCF
ncbi:unnamed protein product [Mucor circinelloides]